MKTTMLVKKEDVRVGDEINLPGFRREFFTVTYVSVNGHLVSIFVDTTGCVEACLYQLTRAISLDEKPTWVVRR